MVRFASRFTHKALSVLMAALLLAGSTLAFAQAAKPMDTVQTTVSAILVILRNPDFNFEADRPRIRTEIRQAFDETAMAQSVLATNWREASKPEQDEFRELLMQTIESTYIGRIRAYTGEIVEFRGEKIDGNRAEVSTMIVTAGAEIPLLYKLRERNGLWYVYDVEIENVSMVSTYRETYRSVVRRSGMDGLLQQMREKIVELEARENA